jgi:hypothetical protein
MKRHSLEKILECTLHCCGITEREWQDLKNTRMGKAVRTKQLVSHIAFSEGFNHREIAAFLSFTRTTALHHIKTLRDEMMIYPSVQGLVDRIVRMLD